MKKETKNLVIALIVIVLVIVFLFAVLQDNKTKDPSSDNKVVMIYRSKYLSEIGEFVSMTLYEEQNFQYDIKEEEFNITDEVTVKVPVLYNFGNSVYTEVNNLIKSRLKEELLKYAGEDGNIKLRDYDYEITMEREQFISILFEGVVSASEGSEEYVFVRPLNFDLLKQKEVDLADFIEAQDDFLELMYLDSNAFEGKEGAKKYITKEMKKEELKKIMYETDKRVYFNKYEICVVVDLPHEQGDCGVMKVMFISLDKQ